MSGSVPFDRYSGELGMVFVATGSISLNRIYAIIRVCIGRLYFSPNETWKGGTATEKQGAKKDATVGFFSLLTRKVPALSATNLHTLKYQGVREACPLPLGVCCKWESRDTWLRISTKPRGQPTLASTVTSDWWLRYCTLSPFPSLSWIP